MKNTISSLFWKEKSRKGNEFYPENCYCHKIEFYEEIVGQTSVTENLFFMIRGRFPDDIEEYLFDLAMVTVSNPGPRSFECRSAMNAAVGNADVCNWLIAGLGASGGMYRGANHVEKTVSFFEHMSDEHGDQIESLHENWLKVSPEVNGNLPGFGLFYGESDHRVGGILEKFFSKTPESSKKYKALLQSIKELCRKHSLCETLTIQGAFSFILFYLGFTPKAAGCIYLMAVLPGIITHCLEQNGKNWNEYPFWWGSEFYRYCPKPEKDEISTGGRGV